MSAPVLKGVVQYGDNPVIHLTQTETVWKRLSYCGKAIVDATGSGRAVSCPDCLTAAMRLGARVR